MGTYRAPRGFYSLFARHNLHALTVAALSALAALLAWGFCYFFLGMAAIGFLTVVHGEALRDVAWVPWAVGGGLAGTLVWAILDRWWHRFQPLRDRAIIGWHLVPEILLFPARLTLSVWDHLRAVLLMSREDINRAWDVLQEINTAENLRLGALSLMVGEQRRLDRLLQALQITGLVSMRRGEEDWILSIPGSRREYVQALRLDSIRPDFR